MANQRPSEQGVMEWWCRLTLRGLGTAFATVGAAFFLFPDATVRVMNAAGALFGNYAPAPPSELRFWLSLSIGYMVMVTALAFTAERDLRRHRSLLLFLALGKATSSLTCLGYYTYSLNAFLYLLNFLVDGSISIIVIVIWASVPMLGPPRPAQRTAPAASPDSDSPEPPVLSAMIEAMIPTGGPFPEGAREMNVVPDIDAFVGGSGTSAARALRAGLRLIDFIPAVLPPWRGRFSRLPLDERVKVLEAWERSRFVPLRQLVHNLKVLTTASFYSRPEIERRLRYPHPLTRVPRGEAPA